MRTAFVSPTEPSPAPAVLAALCLALCLALSALAPSPARAGAVADAMAAMDVEHKVGQLFCVAFKGDVVGPELRSFIEERHVGGLIFYDSWGNVRSPRQVARLARDAQRTAVACGQPGLILAVDQEGGPVARLREGFAVAPSNMALGASGDPELSALGALVTAEQLRSVGLNCNFAPVADVNSNPANPIIGVRSYSPSPHEAAMFADVAVRAYTIGGVISVAKHFPGHGDTGFDSHLRLPKAEHSRKRLDAVELFPFRGCIAAKVPAIMTAHVEVPALEPEPGLPATLSRRVLTDLLRGELGYRGLVVTDSMGMGAIRENFGVAEAALRAVKAGADVLLYGADRGVEPADFIPAWERIVRAVKEGEISMQRLDESVERILRTKATYGILIPGLPDPARAARRVGTPEQLALVRALAARGVALGRDYGDRRPGAPGSSGPVLPLRDDEDVLLLWPGMKDTSLPPQGLPARMWAMALPRDPGDEDVARALNAARGFDAVAVFTTRADKRPGQAALVNALLARTPRLAVASLDTPYDIRSMNSVPCWLAAYSDAPASVAAVLDVLYGRAPAMGKLPLQYPPVTP